MECAWTDYTMFRHIVKVQRDDNDDDGDVDDMNLQQIFLFVS